MEAEPMGGQARTSPTGRGPFAACPEQDSILPRLFDLDRSDDRESIRPYPTQQDVGQRGGPTRRPPVINARTRPTSRWTLGGRALAG
jgi:hypothetical protein